MKTKKLLTTAFAVISIAAIMGSCKDENMEISGLCPLVVATDPLNLATNVPLDKQITATFNEVMNPAGMVPDAFTLSAPGAKGTMMLQGIVTYNSTNYKMSFTPSEKLVSGTTYTGTISSGLKDLNGNSLQEDYVWTFSTGTVVIPSVISVSPVNLASGVPLNSSVTADFSQAMDASTITDLTFTLKTGTTFVPGTVAYSGTTATFTPSGSLLSGNTYTATISADVKNPAGVSIPNDYIWTFNTNATLGGPMVDLKSVEQFGIIAGVGVSNAAGISEIHNLNVGIYPGVRSSITGFPPAIIVNGAMYASDDIAPPGVPAMLLQAKNDLTAAYLFAEGATAPAPATVSGDQGGKTLAPGIYKSTSTLLIQAGDLTLDAQGDANAVWIFQIASDFTTIGGGTYPSTTGGNVILTGGAQAKNIFWQVGSSATIGNNTSFNGNVLALTTITMNAGSTANGRMLARNGSVTMTSTNKISKP